MAGAVVFAVIEGTLDAPRASYLDRAASLDDVHADLHGVDPIQVLRIGATCEESKCAHFDGSRCGLAARVDQMLEPVVDILPRCALRRTCRWYAERGGSICLRCPQVVTLDRPADERVRAAATPPRG